MTSTHARRLTLSLIPMLCLGAQCSFGDSEVGRVKDDGGPPLTDGFVADISSDVASDAHPAADMIPASDTARPDAADSRTATDSVDDGPSTDVQPDVRPATDGAGPDAADSSPTPDVATSGTTCGPTSVHVPTTTLGFQPVATDGTTIHALVSEVADDHLVLQPDAGAPVTFLWWGPPLSGEFSVGEDVNCTQASSWSIVTSGKRSAEISFGYSNTSRRTGGTTPGGATYSTTPQCESWQSIPCGTSSVTLTTIYYRIVVSQNGESVDIPMGTTAQLGESRVTNVLNTQSPSGTICGAVWDAKNWDGLSVLRSIGP
jgi:hypothetical protein